MQRPVKDLQFDFGQNWAEFSDFSITRESIALATRDFSLLLEGVELKGKRFLDIGFGQGFGLLCAASLGAITVGCDINPKCSLILENNRKYFTHALTQTIPIVIGSILDKGVITQLREIVKESEGAFDIVHSWGVLHHTGNMRKAIENSASLVKPGGHFVVAIYNRHWSSKFWLGIKWIYGKSPFWMRRFLVYLFYPVIWLAKFLVTGENPKKMSRGMDFFYDVVDWIGGYPYEYASLEEVLRIIEPLGFKCLIFKRAQLPTGNNQFVFVKQAIQQDSSAMQA